jgi:hypothetical protein
MKRYWFGGLKETANRAVGIVGWWIMQACVGLYFSFVGFSRVWRLVLMRSCQTNMLSQVYSKWLEDPLRCARPVSLFQTWTT